MLARDSGGQGGNVSGKPMSETLMGLKAIPPLPNFTSNLSSPIATAFPVASPNSGRVKILLNCNGNNNREGDCLDFHSSENDGAATGGDLRHALAVKGTPCTLPFVTSNAEVTTTDDGRELAGLTSAFDLLGVAGVEADLAEGTVLLNEADGDDAGASFVDELTDEGDFVHG